MNKTLIGFYYYMLSEEEKGIEEGQKILVYQPKLNITETVEGTFKISYNYCRDKIQSKKLMHQMLHTKEGWSFYNTTTPSDTQNQIFSAVFLIDTLVKINCLSFADYNRNFVQLELRVLFLPCISNVLIKKCSLSRFRFRNICAN